MRLSLATRIFLGYAVVLVTFGAVSLFSVTELHRGQVEIRLLSEGYLALSQTAATLESFQKNQANDTARLRLWTMGAPPVDEPRAAFMAIGDLAGHLAGQGLHLGLADAAALVLCLREDWPLWSYNPRFDEVARRIPQLRRYQPTGL